MEVIIRPTGPIIAPGAGATLRKDLAEKVASQWLDVINADVKVAEEKFIKFIQGPRGGIGGSKQAQIKWVRRVSEAWGSACLGYRIAAGKRARFAIIIDTLIVTEPIDSLVGFTSPESLSQKKKPSWVSGSRVFMGKSGPASQMIVDDEMVVASISRHCLARLIQRCGIEKASDVTNAFRSVWPYLSMAEIVTRERRCEQKSDSWLIPATLPMLEEPIVFIMQGPGRDDTLELFVAVTALTWDQLRPTQFLPIRNLYEATKNTRFLDFHDKVTRLKPLYEAVRGIRFER